MQWSKPALVALLLAYNVADAQTIELQIVDGSGRALSDVVVSLHGDAPLSAAAGTLATLDQQYLQFQPPVLAVQVGTEVEFPNLDRVAHHVYSFSAARRFELRLYRNKPEQPVRFDTAGTVVLGCNIHDWMLGYIHVVDTPWFATTGTDGLARIAAAPPGRYTLRLWHPRLRGDGPWTAVEIDAPPEGVSVLRYELDVDPPDPRFLSPRQRAAEDLR